MRLRKDETLTPEVAADLAAIDAALAGDQVADEQLEAGGTGSCGARGARGAGRGPRRQSGFQDGGGAEASIGSAAHPHSHPRPRARAAGARHRGLRVHRGHRRALGRSGRRRGRAQPALRQSRRDGHALAGRNPRRRFRRVRCRSAGSARTSRVFRCWWYSPALRSADLAPRAPGAKGRALRPAVARARAATGGGRRRWGDPYHRPSWAASSSARRSRAAVRAPAPRSSCGCPAHGCSRPWPPCPSSLMSAPEPRTRSTSPPGSPLRGAAWPTRLAERRGLLRQLATADTANETASIRARLRAANRRIDRARAQLRRLQNRVSYAAVSVDVRPRRGSSAPATPAHGRPVTRSTTRFRCWGPRLESLSLRLLCCCRSSLLAAALWGGNRLFVRRRREKALDV